MTSPAGPHDQLIEAYVLDITRRLPRRIRNDVAFELRALLSEGLRDRAADAGRLPDEAMALDLVREFGRPDDVAARYHPPGEPIIPAAYTSGFAWATAIGMALQWGVSLPLTLSGDLAPGVPEDGRFTAWWVSYGLGAFGWPGFLVTMMLIAGGVRRIWPPKASEWTPRTKIDRDHVNRPAMMLGLGLALCGVATWVCIAWIVTTFESPFSRALALDPGFMAARAPAVLLFWASGIALLVVLIVEGRWRSLTRRVDLASKVAACALFLWFVMGGRIFVTDAADEMTKVFLVLFIVMIACEISFSVWRQRARIRQPQPQTGPTQTQPQRG